MVRSLRFTFTLTLVFSCIFVARNCQAFSGSTSQPSNMPRSNKKIVASVVVLAQKELKKAGDPKKVKAMQSYCKTTMPMYGIRKPDRAKVENLIHSTLKDEQVSMTRPLYRDCIQSLWKLPHREEKYLAIDFALHHKHQICWENLSLYETFFIRDHHDIMNWDFVDPIAINLIGKVALANQARMEPILRQWIDDDQMWIRRTAILAQLKHKKETNEHLLFDLCRSRMHEKEFFIRKAIGWALREYGKTNPEAVVQFLKDEKANLSGLSYREGSRILIKEGRM